jgi:hypothetical protein
MNTLKSLRSSRWITLLGLLILWVAVSVFSYFAWTRGADHRDFYPRWAGSRLALFEGRPLYSEDTIREMQILLYGAPLPPDRDQQGFAYPAQIIPLLLPLWYINDVEIAASIWQGFSIVLIVITLSALRQGFPRIPLLVMIGAVFWIYCLVMLFQAQITALPMFSLGIGFYLYWRNADVFSGVIFSLGFVKAELMLIPVIVMIIIALRERRWKVPMVIGLSGLIQLLVTVLMFGWWVPDWIANLQRYSSYAATSFAPQTALSLGIIPLAGIGLILATALVRMRWSVPMSFAVSLPLGMLFLPQTLIWNLTLLLPALVLAWRGRARMGVVAVWCVGWVFFVINASNPEFWRVQNLMIPLLTVVVVSWASHRYAPQQSTGVTVQPAS